MSASKCVTVAVEVRHLKVSQPPSDSKFFQIRNFVLTSELFRTGTRRRDGVKVAVKLQNGSRSSVALTTEAMGRGQPLEYAFHRRAACANKGN